MEEGRKEGRAPFDVRVGGRWGWQSRRGEWSGRLTGWAERGEERAELAAWGWWWWWWRRWLKAEETGGCVRVGFLAWHRGIDTPVGAQRHQRLLRRPTSLHLERTSSPFPLPLPPPTVGQTFTPRIDACHRRPPFVNRPSSFHRSNISRSRDSARSGGKLGQI